MTNIKQLLWWGQSSLFNSIDSADIDAEILLCHVLQCPRIYLYSHPETPLDDSKVERYKQLIQSINRGCPIAYITGKQAFWTLELDVNEHTLIPRPETELLVELGLEHIKQIDKPAVLDLGTGSGSIALAIASERPDAVIIAVDCSFPALAIAKQNQLRYGLHRVHFINANWFDAIQLSELFDLIVTNPPYIANTDPHLNSNIRFEPRQALTSGPKGLDAASHILSNARTFLKPKGWLFIEHGYNQKEPINRQLIDNGYSNPKCLKDHAGLDRIAAGQK